MKFCTNCGAKLEDNVKFCTECGTKVEVKIQTPQPEPEPVREPIQEPVSSVKAEPVYTAAPEKPNEDVWEAPEKVAEEVPAMPEQKKQKNAKKKSRVWIIVLAAVVVIALIVGAVALFGGKDQGAEADWGKYKGVSCIVSGVDLGADDEWIELSEKGKAKLFIMGKEYDGKWTLDGEKFVLKQGGDEFEGTLKDGVLEINIADAQYTFSMKDIPTTGGTAAPKPEISKPDKPAEPEKTEPVTFKAVSAVLEGEKIDADFLKMMGDGYITMNGDGTGMFSFFGDVFPVTYDDKYFMVEDMKMPYTFDGAVMKFVMEEGAEFTMEVTNETPPTASPEINDPEMSTGDSSYSMFNGTYRAKLKNEADGDTFVEVTGYNDFIILEYFYTVEGSVYGFMAEEFWPDEDGFTDDGFVSVDGLSQTFSSMSMMGAYDMLPQNRCITLTDDGLVLNYDDSDAEYFERDDSFTEGHSTADELWDTMSTYMGNVKKADDVVGSWAFWSGWEAGCVTFEEDGSMEFFWKTPHKPIEIYRGAWGLDTETNDIRVMAERIGEGSYPYEFSWSWEIDEYGDLTVTDVYDTLLQSMDGECTFWKADEPFFTEIPQTEAMGYVYNFYEVSGNYKDQYGNQYYYTYEMPQFALGDEALDVINEDIYNFYNPIIETELAAMEQSEFLTYDMVTWESNIYEDILILHIYATTYDWEEHSVFYYDIDDHEVVYADELLDRLDIDEDYFLETVRNEAEAIYIENNKNIPEKDKEAYGYYEMLDWTVSDDAVNLGLPIFVDRYGNVYVYVKIGSLAGSGMIWDVIAPFASADYHG